MYQQLIQPNLGIVGESGLCLVYVREIFGLPAKYPDAANAWDNAVYKFPGEQPPTNATVPVWFSYDGPTNGHVAVSVNGAKFYSVSAQGDKIFNSLQELMDFIGGGIAYLGWSEDVDGERVVEPVPSPTPTPAPAPIPSGQTITLPETTGPWHLYAPGFAGNMAHVLGLIEPEVLHESLTYAILASLGNGVYRIHSQDYGVGDLWTKGSDVIIK